MLYHHCCFVIMVVVLLVFIVEEVSSAEKKTIACIECFDHILKLEHLVKHLQESNRHFQEVTKHQQVEIAGLAAKLKQVDIILSEHEVIVQKINSQNDDDEVSSHQTQVRQQHSTSFAATQLGDGILSTDRNLRRSIINSIIQNSSPHQQSTSNSRQLSSDTCSAFSDSNETVFLVDGICKCTNDVLLGDNRSVSSMADKIEDHAVRLDDIELARTMVNVTLKVRTSFEDSSPTSHAVDIGFFLPKHMYWTQQSELFPESARQGDIFVYSIELIEIPTKLKFIAQGSDGWNFDYLEVLIDDEPSVFVVCPASASDTHVWVDTDSSDAYLVQQFDIVGQSCSYLSDVNVSGVYSIVGYRSEIFEAYIEVDDETDKKWLMLTGVNHASEDSRLCDFEEILPLSPNNRAHDRVIDFYTSNLFQRQVAIDGNLSSNVAAYWDNYTLKSNHNAYLPEHVTATHNFRPDYFENDVGFGGAFLFYKGGTYHYGACGEAEIPNRFECDNFPNGDAEATNHNVYVSFNNTGEVLVSFK